MAKKSRNNSPRSRRVITNNTRRELPPRETSRLHRLTQIEDLRVFKPLRKLMTTNMVVAPIKARVNPRTLFPSFYVAKDAILCARRKIRKEVLFAKNKQGRGNKKPRYSENSTIKCK